ncbi:hypothetical protein ACFYTQ_37040 [Nocardia sp. NPDC004068]|uniref:hypothetical protein n=1 Tax=Nocardia sp. NPDC004068 TaxID=3364303 RepID=UPI00368ED6B0
MDNTRFWRLATWSLAGFFVLQVAFMAITSLISNSDTVATYVGSFVAASIAGTLLALLVRWKTRGAGRGVALAAATAAGIWTASTAAIGFLIAVG